MNLDQSTATGFTPYELSPNNTLLTMSRDQARASMHRHSLAMAARWLAMTAGGMGAMAAFAPPALAFPLAVGVAGFLQRWASSGMLHEATHGTLWRERSLNDRLGRLLAGLAVFDFRAFQHKHLLHHKFVGTARDPEVIDMGEYGFDRLGMSRMQALAMYARVFMPRMLMKNMSASAHAMTGNPWPLAMVGVALLPFALLGVPVAMLMLAWFVGSFTIRPLLWLIANSTEHDTVLADEIEQRSTPRGRRLAGLSKEIQWLAVSRERHGLIFWIAAPESERLWHGDHHAQGSLPGGSLAEFVAARKRFDPLYAAERRVTHGLFFGRNPALRSLIEAHEARRSDQGCSNCLAPAMA